MNFIQDFEIKSFARFKPPPSLMRVTSTLPDQTSTESFISISDNSEFSKNHYSAFDHDQLRYRTFFNKIRFIVIAKLILCIEIPSHLALITFLCIMYVDQCLLFLPNIFLLISIAICLISFICSLCYSVGVYKKNYKLIKPRLVALVAMLILFFCALMFSIAKWYNPGQLTNNTERWRIIIAFGSVLALIIEFYLMHISFGVYRYVKDWNVYLNFAL